MILYKGKLGHWNLCLLWSQKSPIYLLLEASIPDHQWHTPECTSSSVTCPILCGQGAPSKLLLALQPLLYLRCSCHQPCLPRVPWTSLISSPVFFPISSAPAWTQQWDPGSKSCPCLLWDCQRRIRRISAWDGGFEVLRRGDVLGQWSNLSALAADLSFLFWILYSFYFSRIPTSSRRQLSDIIHSIIPTWNKNTSSFPFTQRPIQIY